MDSAPQGFRGDDVWLAQVVESVIDPALPIIDAHHHLWENKHGRYLVWELASDIATSGHNVQATVYVEAWSSMHRKAGPEWLRPVGETEFANGMAAISASGNYGDAEICAAIVARADLRRGEAVTEVLQAHLEAAPNRFRGIRAYAQWDDSTAALPTGGGRENDRKGLLLDKAFRIGVDRLISLELVLEVMAYHRQLRELANLAQAKPRATILLNHMGTPLGVGPYAERRREVFAEWKQDMSGLARNDNVYVKLGGFGSPAAGFPFWAQPRPPTSAELAEAWGPYIESCIELFGPKRCMFESNFPVEKTCCSYRVLWNAFKRITASFSPEEKSALFSGTARKAYRLGRQPELQSAE